MTEVVRGDEPFSISELVLSSVVRILTNHRVFRAPSTTEDALTFAEDLRAQPHCIPVSPGSRHWAIFTRLCRESGARGPLVPDAYLAARAIEHGCEWVTCDVDFARFKGLRWRHPFA